MYIYAYKYIKNGKNDIFKIIVVSDYDFKSNEERSFLLVTISANRN